MSKYKKSPKAKYQSNLAEIDEDLNFMMKEMEKELGISTKSSKKSPKKALKQPEEKKMNP